MATTSQITGRIVLPDNTAPVNGVIKFVLSGVDTDTGEVVTPYEVSFALEADGDLPTGCAVYKNTDGLRGTIYRVYVLHTLVDAFGVSTSRREVFIGNIQVDAAGPLVISTLINVGAPSVPGAWIFMIPQVQYDADLAAKANIASPTFTGTVSGITKAMVGLGNVDNTTDAGKPVSTAQATAIGLKANKAGDTFTGPIAAPSVAVAGVTQATDADYVFVHQDAAGNVAAAMKNDGTLVGFDALAAATTDLVEWAKVSGKSWLPENCLLIFGVMGQSNAAAVNVDTGDAIISGASVYPGRALMVSGGPRVSGPTGLPLVDLVEAVTSGRRESCASGFANTLIRDVNAAFGYQPRVATFVSAQTAQPLTELNRGSVRYNNALDAIRDCVAHAEAENLIPIYMGSLWVQGEADSVVQRESHRRGLLRLAQDFGDDAMAITGQSDRPRFFTTQVASGIRRDANAASFYEKGSGLALYDADGLDVIRCAGPMYQFPISSDLLHLSCQGQYLQGIQFARAVYAEFAGQGWHPIKYVGARWLSTTSLRLEFAVPDYDDLALITAEAVTDTTASTKGFQIVDRAGTLHTLTVTIPASIDLGTVNKRYVDIAFAAAPVGPVTVRYAQRPDGATGNGPVFGGRGCIAANATYTPLVAPTNPLRHWLPAFTATIEG